MIRRRPSAAVRFAQQKDGNILLTGREFQALRSISRGMAGKEQDRKKLFSIGMVTSAYGKTCVLTPFGRQILEQEIAKRKTQQQGARS